jgi:SAM-dependent methyltransferase
MQNESQPATPPAAQPVAPPAPRPAGGPLAIPDAWNLVSDGYTAELLPQFSLYAADALELAELPPRPSILDVATGPGTLALMAAARGAQVSALDFSAGMIANLRRRAAEQGAADLDIRIGDGQALPFADNAFDGAFSLFGLMFFPDRGAGFRELLRTLRPGGKAVVSAWAPAEGAFAALPLILREILPELPAPTGKPPLADPEVFRAEMEAAGFRDVSIAERAHVFPNASTREFWEKSQRSTAPIVLLRSKLGEAKWAGVSEGVLERLRARFGDGPQNLSGRAWLGVGRK